MPIIQGVTPSGKVVDVLVDDKGDLITSSGGGGGGAGSGGATLDDVLRELRLLRMGMINSPEGVCVEVDQDDVLDNSDQA